MLTVTAANLLLVFTIHDYAMLQFHHSSKFLHLRSTIFEVCFGKVGLEPFQQAQ